jgi:protein-S-isoprenylcysteine O-methyltransferase Ste14
MDTATRAAASLLAGVVALLVVGVGVTEALAPHVWPSLLVGIPAGLAAAVLAGLSVWWWLGRRQTRGESV